MTIMRTEETYIALAGVDKRQLTTHGNWPSISSKTLSNDMETVKNGQSIGKKGTVFISEDQSRGQK